MKRSTDRRASLTVTSVVVAGLISGTLACAGLCAQESRSHEHGHEGQALKTWRTFLLHLQSSGHAELIPEGALEEEPGDAATLEGTEPAREDDGHEGEEGEAHEHDDLVDLRSSDPIKGILFRLSAPILNLDALFEENQGKVPADELEGARKLVSGLVESDDPYFEVYGKLFKSRLELQEEQYEEALATLKSLSLSTFLLPLPKREVQHGLVKANRALGDDTLAILELQLLLVTLPPEEVAERTWAKEQLREIRQKHDGPLKATGESMVSISTLLEEAKVGATTQKEQRRVEEVLEKIVKILEADRCPNCGTPKCPDCGKRQCSCPGGT